MFLNSLIILLILLLKSSNFALIKEIDLISLENKFFSIDLSDYSTDIVVLILGDLDF